MHINVRSIHANINGFEELLVQSNISPDIIALSETKLKVSEKCKVSLSGYVFIHNGTVTNAGGVGFFIKVHLSYTICQNLELGLSFCEDLWLTVNHKNTKCTIGVVYKHPH